MANQLSAISGSGSQTNTQSPQSAGGTVTGAEAGSVQPGTTSALLVGNSGVGLHQTSLTTVSLSASPSTGSLTSATAPPARHSNPLLFGISALLLLVAVAIFIAIERTGQAAKSKK